MASPQVEELPFYLQGNYAPVSEEVTATDLVIEGEIPASLRGLYLRNGPNPRHGDPGHWFLGDGMVHGVRLEEGRALWYRNRWVRTKSYAGEPVEFVTDEGVNHTSAVANTNIIGHAGRLLALVENCFPTEITPELDTIGLEDFGGKLQTAFTAHPKICPKTGELHFFGYRFAPPFLTYMQLDPEGNFVKSEEIAVPGPTMMHDFAITENHAIFMDLPIVFNPEGLEKGMPYLWSDDYGARLGVMPRNGTDADTQWFEIDPCYIFHPMNASEKDGRISLDVARYPQLWRGSSASFETAMLHRFEIDLAAKKVNEQQLDDRAIEFPRIDPRRESLANRFGYAVVNAIAKDQDEQCLAKYDLQTGKTELHSFGRDCKPGEGVFVPASESAAEDEGYVLAYVYDPARDGSDFVILDATNFGGPPLARIRLPQRVPFGFHGNWVPEPAAGFAAERAGRS